MPPTRRRAVLLAGLVVTSLCVGPAAVPSSAQGAGDSAGTSSAKTVAWSPRHPDDAPEATDPAPFQALKDWKLSVSQTKDLQNQTIKVSWQGTTNTLSLPFVQVMQCWSAGPDVEPTREQCAYGGVSDADVSTSGSSRTRALSGDSREQTYFYDGDLAPVSVDGAVPPATWPESAGVVLGSPDKRCPVGTTGYTTVLTPPRQAVLAGTAPTAVVLEAPTGTPPASLSRDENGSSRTYSTVSGLLDLSAAAAGLSAWPLGQYRTGLGCLDGSGVERARLVGYLERAKVGGAEVWRRSFRQGGVSVPYDPVGDDADEAPTDPYDPAQVLEFLKPRSTNEVFAAKSRPDGSGSVFMEMLSDLEAQHLACGRVEGKQVRSCWLVAVPRFGPQPGSVTIPASPLSQTLWDRRISVPLSFAPVASGCQVGSGLKQILSNSSALLALRSWQPTFCGRASTASSVVGPLPDDSIRSGLDEANRMGIATVPDPARPGTVVTAPVTTSGVVIGFLVDRQLIPQSERFNALHETRAEVLNLNARLVAKLLTQSYDGGAYPNGGKKPPNERFTFTPERLFPANNPRTLYQDPEFLRLNPDFALWLEDAPPALLGGRGMSDLLVAGQGADAYQVLWRWLLGDAEAKRFIDGTADPDGMLVNPYYKGVITEETSTFDLFDPTCVDLLPDKVADDFPLLCQPNEHPRVKDDAEAAQAAVRGDTKRVNQTPERIQGSPGEVLSYLPEARQSQGQAGMLVVTTSAHAERFGLPTARLRNADGTYVAATAASMTSARQQMPVRPDGVLVPEPNKIRNDGYPLTVNGYAMVDVAATTQEQNNAFAVVLDYAAGAGQASGRAIGQLPPGYAPLGDDLSAQARKAATLLRDPASLLPRPAVDEVAVESANDDGTGTPRSDTDGGSDTGGSTGDGAAAGTSDDAAGSGQDAAPPGDAKAAAPVAGGTPPAVAGPLVRTSGAPSSLRWLVPVLLVVGLLAGIGGRVLPLFRRSTAP